MRVKTKLIRISNFLETICWASEIITGPVNFETPRPDWPVHFLKLLSPGLTRQENQNHVNITVYMLFKFAVLRHQGRENYNEKYIVVLAWYIENRNV